MWAEKLSTNIYGYQHVCTGWLWDYEIDKWDGIECRLWEANNCGLYCIRGHGDKDKMLWFAHGLFSFETSTQEGTWGHPEILWPDRLSLTNYILVKFKIKIKS